MKRRDNVNTFRYNAFSMGAKYLHLKYNHTEDTLLYNVSYENAFLHLSNRSFYYRSLPNTVWLWKFAICLCSYTLWKSFAICLLVTWHNNKQKKLIRYSCKRCLSNVITCIFCVTTYYKPVVNKIVFIIFIIYDSEKTMLPNVSEENYSMKRKFSIDSLHFLNWKRINHYSGIKSEKSCN